LDGEILKERKVEKVTKRKKRKPPNYQNESVQKFRKVIEELYLKKYPLEHYEKLRPSYIGIHIKLV